MPINRTFHKLTETCVTSGFRREVVENCALLCHYSANRGNFLPTFRDILSGPSSGFKICPETSVRIYHYSLCNDPDERNTLRVSFSSCSPTSSPPPPPLPLLLLNRLKRYSPSVLNLAFPFRLPTFWTLPSDTHSLHSEHCLPIHTPYILILAFPYTLPTFWTLPSHTHSLHSRRSLRTVYRASPPLGPTFKSPSTSSLRLFLVPSIAHHSRRDFIHLTITSSSNMSFCHLVYLFSSFINV
jgi:hypothetical protein